MYDEKLVLWVVHMHTRMLSLSLSLFLSLSLSLSLSQLAKLNQTLLIKQLEFVNVNIPCRSEGYKEIFVYLKK